MGPIRAYLQADDEMALQLGWGGCNGGLGLDSQIKQQWSMYALGHANSWWDGQ